MKYKGVLVWTCVCLAVLTVAAFAADTDEQTSNGQTAVQRPARPARPGQGRGPIAAPGERGRGPAGGAAGVAAEDAQGARRGGEPVMPGSREDVMQQVAARRMELHRQEIAKLEAIIKIAEEENATKTVEALKALIAEKDKAMKEQLEQAEQRRQELQKRMQERLEERGQRPGTAADQAVTDRPSRPDPTQLRESRQAPQRRQQQQQEN